LRWSQLRHRVEGQLAGCLKKDVRFFMTSYDKNKQRSSHAYIEYKKKIIWNFATTPPIGTGSQLAADHCSQEAFSLALRSSLRMSIDQCVASDNEIIQAIAMWDRRLGKRRLDSLWAKGALSAKAREFLEIRRNAEGIIMEKAAAPDIDRKYLRAFIGIFFDSNFSAMYNKIADTGLAQLPKAKWHHHDDLHITLHYLGDLSPGQVTGLYTDLGYWNEALPDIHLGGLGFFPNRPDFFFLEVEKSNALANLQRTIGKCLTRNGFELENDFNPHVTLARLPKSLYRQGAAFVQNYPESFPTIIKPLAVRVMCRNKSPNNLRRYQELPHQGKT